MTGLTCHLKRRLRDDERGITIVEFAIVAPVLCLMIIGFFDLGHRLYATSVLNGAMQEAARDSALEGGIASTATIDGDVTDIVHMVIPDAQMAFARRSYSSFQDADQPEDFTDSTGAAADGICNDGEPFTDMNDNGVWDADRGIDGTGGARDAVLYTATATYDSFFPMSGFIGIPDTIVIRSSSILRNQPFSEQATRTPAVGNCP